MNDRLAGSRGQLQDHIALERRRSRRVGRQIARRGVKFLDEPYSLGDTRAVMIEGPSREALELVEVK